MNQTKRKPTLLRPIHPNLGVQQRYRAALNRLLRKVRDEVLAAVNLHKNAPKQPIAIDNHPLIDALDRLMINWIERLNDIGENLARDFVKSSTNHYDNNLAKQLRNAGFTVQLQLTPLVRESLQASMGMNVGLIKSIPQEYLADVQKYVYEAMAGGFDLAALTNNLDHAYHIGRNRAKLIARDQANKANAVIEQARRKELGINKAIWRHSGGAKKPRPSHVRANNKVFDADKGMFLDGEWVLPGQAINCGCVSLSVLEF